MLTFGKWLATKKNITTKIQRISPCCSAADSSTNSRHNNLTFSNVLTFQSICRFVASCKRKQICFCKMVTEWKLLSSYSYLFLKGLRVSSIVRERRQREEEFSCQSWSQVATLTHIWNSWRKWCWAVCKKCDSKKYNNNK